MRKLWYLLALTCLVGAEPPQTQLMYLSPELELKLAVAIKREHYPWPAIKVGIGQFGQRWFGHIRFFVAPGAGKAQMLRQCRQVSLLTFRMFDKMVQIDIDASPSDDSVESKAVPWFAASLTRPTALSTPLELPPQSWFEIQGPVTLRPDMHAEGDPALSLAQALTTEWAKPVVKQ
ncbi:hypothetical protein IV102_01175 [bacterium]|nr:hypothetical protein [bacterium]